jgi:hypothetical protein
MINNFIPYVCAQGNRYSRNEWSVVPFSFSYRVCIIPCSWKFLLEKKFAKPIAKTVGGINFSPNVVKIAISSMQS